MISSVELMEIVGHTLNGSCISISLVSLRPSGIIGIRSWELACDKKVCVSNLKGQRHEIFDMLFLQSLSTPESFCVESCCELAEVKVFFMNRDRPLCTLQISAEF
jgi:hypothetical protein